jgi:hypothetical protein
MELEGSLADSQQPATTNKNVICTLCLFKPVTANYLLLVVLHHQEIRGSIISLQTGCPNYDPFWDISCALVNCGTIKYKTGNLRVT